MTFRISVFRYSVRMTMIALVLLVLIGGWILFPDSEGGEESDVRSYEEVSVVEAHYAPLLPMRIGELSLRASVAKSADERRAGLSDTPFLPPDIVKLFVFPESDRHGIWMKNMHYPIDILWLDEASRIVHIETNVQPDTYVSDRDAVIFRPDRPARYVIETVSGFVADNDITIATPVHLPSY